MDLINENKQYAQLVEVVNELKAKIETSPLNPLDIRFTEQLTSNYGQPNESLKVQINNWVNLPQVKPLVTNNNNVTICCAVASNQGASIILPLSVTYLNVTNAKLADYLLEYDTKLPSLFPAGTSIKLVYSVMEGNATPHFYVESVQ